VQFLYDASGVGQPMCQWMVVTLGTWHPFKQANHVLWKQWSKRIFAPLFHDLIPNARFFLKPKLATISTFLTYIRFAYPKFRDELEEAIQYCKIHNSRPIELSHLRDLAKLIEWFIPVVDNLFYVVCLLSCDLMPVRIPCFSFVCA